jgi:3-methyladenine DNA glycosylase/8-oxoguanine DNA glycosylase
MAVVSHQSPAQGAGGPAAPSPTPEAGVREDAQRRAEAREDERELADLAQREPESRRRPDGAAGGAPKRRGTGRPLRAAVRADVTTALERLLGPRTDLTEFYQLAARDRRLGPLARRFRGMKPPRFATVFECAVNAIACQQVTLTLGVSLITRLAAASGTALGEGDEAVHAFPGPADLAALSPVVLRQLGFSRQKGRAIAAGVYCSWTISITVKSSPSRKPIMWATPYTSPTR